MRALFSLDQEENDNKQAQGQCFQPWKRLLLFYSTNLLFDRYSAYSKQLDVLALAKGKIYSDLFPICLDSQKLKGRHRAWSVRKFFATRLSCRLFQVQNWWLERGQNKNHFCFILERKSTSQLYCGRLRICWSSPNNQPLVVISDRCVSHRVCSRYCLYND